MLGPFRPHIAASIAIFATLFAAGPANADPAPNVGASVNEQPTSQTVTAGGTATFTVHFGGFPYPDVCWQTGASSSGPWTDLVGACTFPPAEPDPDASTASDTANKFTTLTLVNVPLAKSGLHIRAQAFSAYGNASTDGAATLTVEVPDSDGDGVADDVDQCPDTSGSATYNGCPVPDSDGDGVYDDTDQCPSEAGSASYNGCPVPDSDGDGIPDDVDACPNQPGPYDGCGLPDLDGDGVYDDGTDQCPNEAGPASNNGCPEPGTLTTSTPTITGTVKPGQTLQANPGEWTEGVSFGYEWLTDGLANGGTSATYAVRLTDVGKRISVRVTGSKTGFMPATTESAQTVVVPPATLVAKTPTISGTAQVGKKLTAIVGTWTTGTTFTYQWRQGTTNISGATAKTFTPRASDVGKRISVRVTGRKANYATVAKSSAQTKAVIKGVLSGAKPKVSGTPRLGKTLSATVGTWTTGAKLKYQWLVGGSAVKYATGKSFKITNAAWKGKRVTFRVTGSKSGYNTKVVTSNPTSPITVPAPTSSCMPGYSPCLPVRADMDCPEIGHQVIVTGSDPYRLDADGDGIGCDSYPPA